MKVPAFLHEAGVTRFAATPEGLGLLEDPTIRGAVVNFSFAFSRAEDRLRQFAHVGEGGNSAVRSVQGVALKASTSSTGKHTYKYGNGSDNTPEDLVGHHSFMHELGIALAGSGVVVPRQYFALRTRYGNYLQAEQHMDGWAALVQWAREHPQPAAKDAALFAAAKHQVLTTAGGSFRLGLAQLHAGNMLVPAEVASPLEGPICVIDQPSSGLIGRLGILAATSVPHTHRRAA